MSSRISMNPESSGMVDLTPWLSDPRPLPSIPPLEDAGRSRSPLPTVLGVSALVVAVVALAVAVATARNAAAAATESTVTTAPAAGSAETAEPGGPETPSPEPANTAAPSAGEESPPEDTPQATASRTAAEPATPPTVRPRPRRIDPAPALRRTWDGATAGTDETEEPAAPDPSSLDALLERALSDRTTEEQRAEALPDTPAREEVLRVLRGLSDEVAQCREDGMGPTVATTRIVIDGATGRVHRATVDGELAWTTAGACVGRTLDQARFSRFARDRFEVQFPYRL